MKIVKKEVLVDVRKPLYRSCDSAISRMVWNSLLRTVWNRCEDSLNIGYPYFGFFVSGWPTEVR